jgi:hypothetical protein
MLGLLVGAVREPPLCEYRACVYKGGSRAAPTMCSVCRLISGAQALEARNARGAGIPTDFAPFKTAYDTLGDKLRPMVFEPGFMRA